MEINKLFILWEMFHERLRLINWLNIFFNDLSMFSIENSQLQNFTEKRYQKLKSFPVSLLYVSPQRQGEKREED